MKKNVFVGTENIHDAEVVVKVPRRPRCSPRLNAALDRGIADLEAGRSMPVEQAFTHIRNKLGLKRKSKRR